MYGAMRQIRFIEENVNLSDKEHIMGWVRSKDRRRNKRRRRKRKPKAKRKNKWRDNGKL
jgi:hypothetical protein